MNIYKLSHATVELQRNLNELLWKVQHENLTLEQAEEIAEGHLTNYQRKLLELEREGK